MGRVKLDLHGVKHENVRRNVIRVIEDNWGKETEIEIITGHSKVMQNLVCEVLNEYDVFYSFGGMFDIDVTRIMAWPHL